MKTTDTNSEDHSPGDDGEPESLAAFKHAYVQRVLRQCGDDLETAALVLNITPDQLILWLEDGRKE